MPLPQMVLNWEKVIYMNLLYLQMRRLGCEWRVLHPFELSGVRHPTDTTPPNQRRLAENDASVELIQTTEYLEDIPMWDKEIIGSIPLDMVTLSIEEEEEVEEGVEEEGK